MIGKSKYSVQIQSKSKQFTLYGYKIEKLAYHGLIRNSFDQYVLYLSKYVSFLSIQISAEDIHLYCALEQKESHDFDKERIWLAETFNSLIDVLPRDIKVSQLSGYEIQVSSFNPGTTKDVHLEKSTNKLMNLVVFKSLEILSSPTKFLQGFFELVNVKLIVGINNMKRHPTYHLAISNCSTTLEDLDKLSNQVIKMLQQVPNLNGKLSLVGSKTLKSSFASLSLGLTRYDIARSSILVLLQLSAKFMSPLSTQSHEVVYPLVNQLADLSPTTRVKAHIPPILLNSYQAQTTKTIATSPSKSQVRLTSLSNPNIHAVLSHFKKKGWVITAKDSINSCTFLLQVKIKSVTIHIYYLLENTTDLSLPEELMIPPKTSSPFSLIIYEGTVPKELKQSSYDTVSIDEFLEL